jgi:8-oxo-dGTP pyrophosphatase MutT (NUDIX family)
MMIAGLEWDIVPTREAAKAYQNDKGAYRDFGHRRSQAVKFFDKPDPNYFSFDSFTSALLEQVFVFDALSVLLRPKRGKGLRRGVLGSDLDCIELIDGQTIRPLLGLHGEMPRPPAPYVQQYIQGVPRSDFQSMWDGRDIAEAGLKGYEGPAFSSDQMLYLPTVPRANSPYGMSLTEMALMVIMTGLRKQAYQLEYYSEGTVPAVYISPGDVNMTPAQIRELQAALNAVAGDQAWHHKIIVTPPGSRIDPQRPAQLADQFDEIIMAEVAMVFDVDPMSLGIVPQVSTAVSPYAAKEMAQASRTVHERTSNKPLLKFLASISNAILHRVCGQDDMKFTFSGMDEAQDQAAQTDMLVKQVQSGLISIDEAREELQRTAWGLDETSGPLVFTQMGPVPLNQVIEMMQQMQPMTSGQNAAANSVTASHQPRAVHHPPSSRPVGTHNPRLGLPSGAGKPDLAAGRGPVSDTPAHAAARAHQAAGKPAAKAVTAELEALARHVRKGRHISTWLPKHVPGVVMGLIAEDLTKGIGIDEAVQGALTVALGPGDYEWLAKAAPQGQQTAQQRAQALAQQYATQVQAAFAQVTAQAQALVAAWLSGALAVTAAALAAMIAALVAKLLGAVLRRLWADAWKAGRDEAAGTLDAAVPHDDAQAMDAWIDSHGRDWLEQITGTREEDVAAGLDEAARNGEDAETIASRISGWLDAAGRAGLIAADQVQRAFNAAVMAVAQRLGVVQKSNRDRGDDRVCARCRANTEAGWINFSEPYPSGEMSSPFHPRCRCNQRLRLALNPARKLAGGRRYVDLPGQEWWPAGSYPSGPAAGGGGPMHAAHDADGIQQYVPGGVPGMAAGGEPPRWGGSGADAVVTVSPGTVSAGRGNPPTRGGGTAGGPYRDRSDETHAGSPDDADDAAWPGERAVGPVPGRSWPLQGYMGGYWPEGGHGTAQAPVTSIGAAERGRPPNAVGKGAADLTDPSPVEAEHVYLQLARNFPAAAIGWVRRARWIGPVWVPWDRIDTDDRDKWAASRQPAKVDEFAAQIRDHAGHVAPSVLVQEPAGGRAFIVDGHHRALAREKLGQKVLAYVGSIDPRDRQAALETHAAQIHSGTSPANKSAGPPVAAGLAVRAADTGRVLMLQRAIDGDDDPAAGFWEFPGGRLDDGEEPLDAARREWAEETGCQPPEGDLTGIWNASNGRYRGFVLTVPSEDAVDVFGGRDEVDNPDDPDRDAIEALAWWDPGMLKDNPAVRPELAEDAKRVRRALKSAQTPVVSTVHHPLGHEGLWHTPDRHVSSVQQLPAYFQNTARALMRDEGMGESQAIATAVNAVREWAEGRAFGGKVKVTPEVQEAAQRAMAEWEHLRLSHH